MEVATTCLPASWTVTVRKMLTVDSAGEIERSGYRDGSRYRNGNADGFRSRDSSSGGYKKSGVRTIKLRHFLLNAVDISGRVVTLVLVPVAVPVAVAVVVVAEVVTLVLVVNFEQLFPNQYVPVSFHIRDLQQPNYF